MNETEAPFGFEIDFLPVGNGEDSGDAICMRWGYGLETATPDQFVMIVDGGYCETGTEVVSHIKKYYFQDGALPLNIDMVVSTHPHQDHISGLIPIVESANNVKWLIMHTPWHHNGLKAWFDDKGGLKEKTIHAKLESGLKTAVELEQLSQNEKVLIYEAFAPWKSREFKGCAFEVLGPTKEFYESLLPDFNVTPGHGVIDRGKRLNPTGRRVASSQCPLDDNGETSAENESSVVLLIHIKPKDKYVLLTSDAGKLSLRRVAQSVVNKNIDISKIDIFQVPHHGSVQNLSPMLLDVLLGNYKEEKDRVFARKAVVSVSKKRMLIILQIR